MSEPLFHIALLNPEIPGNTGNVGRTAIGIGARLHLIRPLGFDTSERAVRRAGIDHWRFVDVQEHESAEAFFSWVGERPIHLFSAHGQRPYTAVPWRRGDVLLFGRESVGLPETLLSARPSWYIPVRNGVRSLNLSNAVAVVAYEALRALEPGLFADAR